MADEPIVEDKSSDKGRHHLYTLQTSAHEMLGVYHDSVTAADEWTWAMHIVPNPSGIVIDSGRLMLTNDNGIMAIDKISADRFKQLYGLEMAEDLKILYIERRLSMLQFKGARILQKADYRIADTWERGLRMALLKTLPYIPNTVSRGWICSTSRRDRRINKGLVKVVSKYKPDDDNAAVNREVMKIALEKLKNRTGEDHGGKVRSMRGV